MAKPPKSMDELAEWLDRATTAKARQVFARLTAWFDRATTEASARVLTSPQRDYTVLHLIARGDVADLHAAVADKTRYLLKVCRVNCGDSLLATEFRSLKMLAELGGERCYRGYIPNLVESFIARGEFAGRRINAFSRREGFHTLEAIRARYRAGLDALHLAWLFKRLLVVAGFAHQGGLVHGAILPPHVLVDAENHGAQLIDWIHAVRIGQRPGFVPTRFRDWYPREVLHREPATPATDIYLAAKSLLYVAGGDPVSERWPSSVPETMRRFVNTCLYSSPRMRPQNAWELHEEFDELLLRLFGPPKYHHLAMA